MYGFKLDGDPRAGGWRFHPAQVMFDPRAVSLQPPLGAFADRQTVPPAFMGSIGEAMHAPSGDFGPASGAPLSATARSTRHFPGQEVVYELSVPDFTGHVSSELAPELAGTFAGAVEKLDHVASLGATTILLMPVQASARRRSDDAWGQAPVSLFAPDPALAAPQPTAANGGFVSALEPGEGILDDNEARLEANDLMKEEGRMVEIRKATFVVRLWHRFVPFLPQPLDAARKADLLKRSGKFATRVMHKANVPEKEMKRLMELTNRARRR